MAEQNGRELQFDYIKVFACILMLFAHVMLVENQFDRLLRFVGSMAPFFFFSVSAHFSRISKSMLQHFIYCACLFVFGSSYLGLIDTSFVQNLPGSFEVGFMQMLAIVILISPELKKIHRRFGMIFLVLGAITCYTLFFFERTYLELTEPGFALLPWLTITLLGLLITELEINYRIRFLIVLTIVGLVILVLKLSFENIQTFGFTRTSMGIGYIVLGLLFYATMLSLAEKMNERISVNMRLKNVITFISNYSLLFMFTHIFVRTMIINNYTNNNIRIFATGVITIAIIYFLDKIKGFIVIQRLHNYLIINLLGFSFVFLNKNENLLLSVYFILGILFAINYKNFKTYYYYHC